MSGIRWRGVITVALLVAMLTACSPHPEEDAMPTPQPSDQSVSDPNPNEPTSELVAGADLIVFGTVESVDDATADAGDKTFSAQTATVKVTEALKGEVTQPTITVTKPYGTIYCLSEHPTDSYDVRNSGLFVLRDAGDGVYELFGTVGVHDDWGSWQRFERVLAGLPERPTGATSEDLATWAAQADIVVFASVRGTDDGIVVRTPRADFSTTAVLTPIEVLKGEMTEPLDVVQGPQPEVPGGTWAFPVTDNGQAGVYFIDTSSGTPTVINTSNPSSINRRNVPLG